MDVDRQKAQDAIISLTVDKHDTHNDHIYRLLRGCYLCLIIGKEQEVADAILEIVHSHTYRSLDL